MYVQGQVGPPGCESSEIHKCWIPAPRTHLEEKRLLYFLVIWPNRAPSLVDHDYDYLPVSLQTDMWRSWYPVIAEHYPAPCPASNCYPRRTLPLPPFRWGWSFPHLPLPVGQPLRHVNGSQSSGPASPGTKWDFRLAAEAALAQVLPSFPTAYHGRGESAERVTFLLLCWTCGLCSGECWRGRDLSLCLAYYWRAQVQFLAFSGGRRCEKPSLMRPQRAAARMNKHSCPRWQMLLT